RILVRKVKTRKGLINNDDAGRFCFFLLGKKASFEQGDSHRAKVTGGGYTRVGSRILSLRSPFRTSFKRQTCGSAKSGARQDIDGPGSTHAGYRFDAVQRRPGQAECLIVLPILGAAQRDFKRQEVIGVKSRGGRFQTRESPDQQPRTNQQ